jgi:hypothetical protein
MPGLEERVKNGSIHQLSSTCSLEWSPPQTLWAFARGPERELKGIGATTKDAQ